MQIPPTAIARAGRVRGRPPPSASSSALLASDQGLADQGQAIIAEIHVGLIDEDGRRAEAAARHHLVGIGLELILDRLLADPGEEFLRIDADTLAGVTQ